MTKNKIRQCAICGSDFKRKSGNHKYCSPECQLIARKARERARYHRHREKINQQRKRPKRGVNQNKCRHHKDCAFSGSFTSSLKFCNYIIETGHMRPFPADACPIWEKFPKSKKKKRRNGPLY